MHVCRQLISGNVGLVQTAFKTNNGNYLKGLAMIYKILLVRKTHESFSEAREDTYQKK